MLELDLSDEEVNTFVTELVREFCVLKASLAEALMEQENSKGRRRG